MQGISKKVEAVRTLLKELKQDKVGRHFAALELYQMLHDTASAKEKAVISCAVFTRKRRLTEAMQAKIGEWAAQEKAQAEEAQKL